MVIVFFSSISEMAFKVQTWDFFLKNLHSWHKFYTTAGRDDRDKSQLCPAAFFFLDTMYIASTLFLEKEGLVELWGLKYKYK